MKLGILILAISGWAMQHLPANGRTGLHGMVLYGNKGKYILDHIPMEHPPHDMQVLALVKLKNENGPELTFDFSKEAWTFKPDHQFSLNDYVNGSLKSFSGDIYQGGFEQGGNLSAKKIQVEVAQIKVVRPIPSANDQKSILVKLGDESFDVNVITPEMNFQKIVNKATGEVLWCVKGPEFFETCN
jgi:hypothetical protein